MAVFTIADLHLSATSDHPMDVFGARWRDYTEKICKNWRAIVNADDTVILPGDISWGMNLSQSRADFALLHSLPGRKLIGKGNHDFWWETAAKLHRFFAENGFDSLDLLYNNAHAVEDFIVCGTRGWFLEENQQQTVGNVDFSKIANRELQRLRISLDAARALRVGEHAEKEILVFLHFPPVWNDFCCREMLELMEQYGVRRCFYGHIHGVYTAPRVQTVGNLTLSLISSDFLNFVPQKIEPLV